MTEMEKHNLAWAAGQLISQVEVLIHLEEKRKHHKRLLRKWFKEYEKLLTLTKSKKNAKIVK